MRNLGTMIIMIYERFICFIIKYNTVAHGGVVGKSLLRFFLSLFFSIYDFSSTSGIKWNNTYLLQRRQLYIRRRKSVSFRRSHFHRHPPPRAAGGTGIRERGKMSFPLPCSRASDVNLHFRKDSKLAHN